MIIKMIKMHEGSNIVEGRHMPYECPAKKQTIGWGRNIEDIGISEKEADYLLGNDIAQIVSDLSIHIATWEELSKARKEVFIDMCYNLGLPRFLKFKKMLAALEKGDVAEVATQMMDSKWARDDVPRRARHLQQLYVNDQEVT